MKKVIITALSMVLAFVFSLNAQELKKADAFKPGWSIGANGGINTYLAEGNNFLDGTGRNAWSPLKSIGFLGRGALTYHFSPLFGLRGMLGYNQYNQYSKDQVTGVESNRAYGSENLSVDGLFNLTNLKYGYDPNRKMDFSVFGGLGAGYANNTSADTKIVGSIRAGLQADYHITEAFALNLIAEGRILTDNYNGPVVDLPVDLGAALALGVTYRLPSKKVQALPEPVIEAKPATVVPEETKPEPVVPAVVEPEKKIETPVVPVPVVPEKPAMANAIREDIFFAINKTNVSTDKQETSIAKVIEFLNANPSAKIIVSGYADKATGSAAVNRIVSKNRAVNIANNLIKKQGVDPERILIKWFGSDVQPYTEVVKNRVVIIKSDNAPDDLKAGETTTAPVKVADKAEETKTAAAMAASKTDVFFAAGKADVADAKQLDAIAAAAEYLKQNTAAKIYISGYADKTTGAEDANIAISKARAVNVANALIQKHKIAMSRIIVSWYGGGVQPYLVPVMNQLVIIKAE